MDTEALKKSLLVKFVEVTQDRLQAIQLGVLDLEKPESNAAAEGVARELHTMKGEARMLGLAAIGQLAHCCEDLLKVEREKKVETRTATDLLLHACDALSDLLDDLEAAKEGSDESNEMAAKMSQMAGTPVPPLKPVRPGAKPKLAPPKKPDASPVPAPTAPSNVAAPRASSPAPRPPEERAERATPIDRSIRVNVEILDALGLLAGDLLVESARSGLRGAEIQGLFERFSRLGDNLLRLSEKQDLHEKERERVAQLESDLHLLRDDAFRFVRSHADGFNTLHGNLRQMADHVAEARLIPLAAGSFESQCLASEAFS